MALKIFSKSVPVTVNTKTSKADDLMEHPSMSDETGHVKIIQFWLLTFFKQIFCEMPVYMLQFQTV